MQRLEPETADTAVLRLVGLPSGSTNGSTVTFSVELFSQPDLFTPMLLQRVEISATSGGNIVPTASVLSNQTLQVSQV